MRNQFVLRNVVPATDLVPVAESNCIAQHELIAH
jgi:hypothetical protein